MARALKFNPGFQTDEEAIANFIVRQQEFETVIGAFRGDANRAPRVLVVAPRGAGKTTLCRRVLAEMRHAQRFSERWQPIFLGEESYTVTTAGEFFLECLFQLRDQVPNDDVGKYYDFASAATSEDDLFERTLSVLRTFANAEKKRLLIIVENFHIILHDQLSNQKSAGAERLLRALRDDRLFGVLATSVAQASLGEGLELPDDFLRLSLKPLTLSECHNLWVALTERDVKLERIRPLQILTGGSPRLLHILAEFMRTPSLRDLMGNLNQLIDQNTEYFKSQLDALPALERKVFAALLDTWDPSTAKRIAEAARVNINTASSMLTRLSERGSVIKEPGAGRTAIYYAAERLFNIYYLMRRRSHPSTRVKALVSFMIEYYDREELVDTTAILVREACGVEPARRSEYHSAFDAIMSRSPESIRDRILQLTPPDFIRSFRADSKTRRTRDDYAMTEVETGNSARRKLIDEIEAAADDGRFDEALTRLQQAIELEPKSVELRIRLALLQQRRGDFIASVETARCALELEPHDAWTNAVLGYALECAEKFEDAEKSYLAALAIDPGQIIALTELVETREAAGDIDGALALLERAVAVDGLVDTTRAKYGQLLHENGRNEEAEKTLREGVEVVANIHSRRALAGLLSNLDRAEEGEELLRSVAEQSGQWEAWADLGSYLLAQRTNNEEAARALRAAIQKGGDDPLLYDQLAKAKLRSGAERSELAAIADELVDRLSENSSMWVIAASIYDAAGDQRRAESAYRSAIEDDEDGVARILLAKLLQSTPSRRPEAEALLREAISLSRGRRICGPSKELAELLIHCGEDAAAREVLLSALKSNDACVCCRVLHGEVCARGGEIDAAKLEFKAALELEDDEIRALTGLSRIVDRVEAEQLIERAIAADPDDPRVLLARARLRVGDIQSQILDGVRALELQPDFVEGHLFLAPLLVVNGKHDEAFNHLEAALSHLPAERELIPNFVTAAMAVARMGEGDRLSKLLAEHRSGGAVEPLAIALQLERGEQPLVAKEVLEVAKDIVSRPQSG